MALDMTLEQYLRGLVSYEIPDDTLRAILFNRGIEENTSVTKLFVPDPDDETVTEDYVAFENKKLRDLSLADIYMYCAGLPSAKNNSSEADGQWKSEQGGYQRSAFDSRQLRAMANDIYARYGEVLKGQKIKLVSIGLRKDF